MNLAELKERAVEGRIKEVIPVTLSDLLGFDLEAMNDYADEQILGEDVPGTLADIHYSVKGVEYEKGDAVVQGTILVEVDASISDILDEADEEA